LPAGTAPSDQTFAPNTQNEIPGQAMNPDISKEPWTSAQDTIRGATSAGAHIGYGHPGSGQDSKELHGDGNFPGKRKKQGSASVGAGQSDVF
jgi:hypothetical protein